MTVLKRLGAKLSKEWRRPQNRDQARRIAAIELISAKKITFFVLLVAGAAVGFCLLVHSDTPERASGPSSCVVTFQSTDKQADLEASLTYDTAQPNPHAQIDVAGKVSKKAFVLMKIAGCAKPTTVVSLNRRQLADSYTMSFAGVHDSVLTEPGDDFSVQLPTLGRVEGANTGIQQVVNSSVQTVYPIALAKATETVSLAEEDLLGWSIETLPAPVAVGVESIRWQQSNYELAARAAGVSPERQSRGFRGAVYSAVAFGIAGAALIALIQEYGPLLPSGNEVAMIRYHKAEKKRARKENKRNRSTKRPTPPASN